MRLPVTLAVLVLLGVACLREVYVPDWPEAQACELGCRDGGAQACQPQWSNGCRKQMHDCLMTCPGAFEIENPDAVQGRDAGESKQYRRGLGAEP